MSDIKIHFCFLLCKENKLRVENVKKQREKYPEIEIFEGLHWKTHWEEIKMLFKQNNIPIRFFHKGNRNKGKVARWASFLKYLFYLKNTNYDYGVLIEDDIIFSTDNITELIKMKILKYKPKNFMKNNEGNMLLTCNVKCIDYFLNYIKQNEIILSNDTFLKQNKLVIKGGKRLPVELTNRHIKKLSMIIMSGRIPTRDKEFFKTIKGLIKS